MSSQILGDIAVQRPSPSAVLELLKPVTWFPPMWAFGCGVLSSGQPVQGRWALVATGIVLAGPLLCGASQAVNDWFDRHVDAINEPGRPIPSGRIPGRWGLWIAIAWSALALVVASTLGRWVFGASVLGVALSWAYSAPPVRLKRNGWCGNAAVGFSYEGLAWVTGAAAMLHGALPDPRILWAAAIYSVGAHGIMTLNDFKSIEGDLRVGVASLPARLGVERAAKLACATMAGAQLVAVGCLVAWARPIEAALVGGVLAIQLGLMPRLLRDPRGEATWYSAVGVTLYVSGMAVCAFALRHPPAG